MSDEDTVINDSDKFELWSFPTLNDESSIRANPPEASPSETDVIKHEQPPGSEAETIDEKDEEIQQLKTELRNRIETVNQLREQLSQTLKQVDEELLKQIIESVRKITCRVLNKELEKPENIESMLQSTLDSMAPLQKCTIYLSADDLNSIDIEAGDFQNNEFQQDLSLSKGDYRIITPSGEIIAVLEERLNKYFGTGS